MQTQSPRLPVSVSRLRGRPYTLPLRAVSRYVLATVHPPRSPSTVFLPPRLGQRWTDCVSLPSQTNSARARPCYLFVEAADETASSLPAACCAMCPRLHSLCIVSCCSRLLITWPVSGSSIHCEPVRTVVNHRYHLHRAPSRLGTAYSIHPLCQDLPASSIDPLCQDLYPTIVSTTGLKRDSPRQHRLRDIPEAMLASRVPELHLLRRLMLSALRPSAQQ